MILVRAGCEPENRRPFPETFPGCPEILPEPLEIRSDRPDVPVEAEAALLLRFDVALRVLLLRVRAFCEALEVPMGRPEERNSGEPFFSRNLLVGVLF